MSEPKATHEIVAERMKAFYADEFAHYVYRKVKNRNPDKQVSLDDNCITISHPDCEDSLHLFSFWEMLGDSPLEEVRSRIDWAVSMIQRGRCTNLYLLYPKTPAFRKHIVLTSQHLESLGMEYTLKLIPYRLDQKLLTTTQGEQRL